MSTYRSGLITPPREEEEVYPYRRAWRSIFLESGLVLGTMLVIFVLVNFLGVRAPLPWRVYINIGLAILPTVLWVVFSRVAESRVLEPRRRLLTTFIVTALVANAIGMPLLNRVFAPTTWLPLQDTVTRIIGYMLTVGILQEFLKYITLRYIVYPEYYRVRTDAVAYGAATAVAYSLVISLNYVFSNSIAGVDVVALRVFATLSIHLVGSLIVAFGLSETAFSDALSLLLPLTVVLAALLGGVAIAMRSSFMNARVGLGVSAQNELFGMAFSVVMFVLPMSVFYFLFNVTERREQDRITGQEA